MTRRWRILLLLVGVAVAAAALLWPREPEPVYQGKKLTAWLRAYGKSYATSEDWEATRAEQRKADEALRALGTNAVPCLVQCIGYESSAAAVRFRWLLYRLVPARGTFLLRNINHSRELAYDALEGFKVLGPVAGGAVPELARMAHDPKRRESRDLAIHALSYLGPNGFSALVEILDTGTGYQRLQAASAILRLQPLTTGVDIPLLLQHTNHTVRMATAKLLGEMAAEGRSVRALQGALTDPDDQVRSAATNALQKIAPEALQPGTTPPVTETR